MKVEIPESLYKRIEEVISSEDTVEEFVLKSIRLSLDKLLEDEDKELSREEEELIKDRLVKLGYLWRNVQNVRREICLC